MTPREVCQGDRDHHKIYVCIQTWKQWLMSIFLYDMETKLEMWPIRLVFVLQMVFIDVYIIL